jgi:hypothetical protein
MEKTELVRAARERIRKSKSGLALPPADWCGISDIDRFAVSVGVGVFCVLGGYPVGEEGVALQSSHAPFMGARCGSEVHLDKPPQRSIASFALINVCEIHWELADVSSCFAGNGGSAALHTMGEVREEQDAYSYHDVQANDELFADEDTWLQGFWPRLCTLGWKFTRITDLGDVYQLVNPKYTDNGAEVVGKEGLKQYFLIARPAAHSYTSSLYSEKEEVLEVGGWRWQCIMCCCVCRAAGITSRSTILPHTLHCLLVWIAATENETSI